MCLFILQLIKTGVKLLFLLTVKIAVRVTNFYILRDSECLVAVVSDSEVHKTDEVR